MNNKKVLVINSIMLYLITFSNYFFSFITVPYQTRVLGPVIYGKIGFATAIMLYFQLFLDFGFLLSGTEEVALNKDNQKMLNKIYSGITFIKIIFIILSSCIFIVVVLVIPTLRQDFVLYLLFFIATAINSFLPDYIYRGLERMNSITYRTISIRILTTLAIFVFLKKPNDYLIIPLLLLLGNFLAVFSSHVHLQKKMRFKFTKIDKKVTLDSFNKSKSFFASRIVSTIYTTTNTIILKKINPNGQELGYYTAADRLMSTGKSLLSPISDSVYPYMVKNKDFKLIKKILKICMPVIIVGIGGIYYFAEPLCILIFGAKFKGVAPILRALLPIGIITLPEYLFGFPTLSAMGLTKKANSSIVFATWIYAILLGMVFLARKLTIINLCHLTALTEFNILLYRIIVIIKNRHLLN